MPRRWGKISGRNRLIAKKAYHVEVLTETQQLLVVRKVTGAPSVDAIMYVWRP